MYSRSDNSYVQCYLSGMTQTFVRCDHLPRPVCVGFGQRDADNGCLQVLRSFVFIIRPPFHLQSCSWQEKRWRGLRTLLPVIRNSKDERSFRVSYHLLRGYRNLVKYSDGDGQFKCWDKWRANFFQWFLVHLINPSRDCWGKWRDIFLFCSGSRNKLGPEGPELVKKLFSAGGVGVVGVETVNDKVPLRDGSDASQIFMFCLLHKTGHPVNFFQIRPWMNLRTN